jgi:hypothetical protein
MGWNQVGGGRTSASVRESNTGGADVRRFLALIMRLVRGGSLGAHTTIRPSSEHK